ncbi:hypothetical protein CUR178_00499 [Leishmania enriettii]|uniref:Uncharacterized protein n=1 Tax=Leishmania enriettii TaxID=5663 RepID=A0A836K9Z7_LEIEN|nr:hypothetical protein CUR178_00499 [Leishmania enriettii]
MPCSRKGFHAEDTSVTRQRYSEDSTLEVVKCGGSNRAHLAARLTTVSKHRRVRWGLVVNGNDESHSVRCG